jgi:hypothetical protein
MVWVARAHPASWVRPILQTVKMFENDKENVVNDRPGCLSGLLKLAFLNFIFDFLQERFGFGRGASCTGCGCGVILLVLLIIFSCSVITGTNWGNLGF